MEIEQPVFGANYIKGKVRAQPNGNYVGEVKFKLYFKAGGAIEYGQALLRAAKTAQGNFHRGGLAGDDPPPYAPAGAWHEAPPPAYQPPPGYYGWLPQHDAFSGPAPNTVFVSDNPPPYPGISKSSFLKCIFEILGFCLSIALLNLYEIGMKNRNTHMLVLTFTHHCTLHPFLSLQ